MPVATPRLRYDSISPATAGREGVDLPVWDKGGARHDALAYPNIDREGTSDSTAGIESLIALATAGDPIFFPRGIYRVSATLGIDKSLSFAMARGAYFDVRLPIDSEPHLFDVDASNVGFEGLTFDLSNAPAGTLTTRHICIIVGSDATQYSNIVIEKCRFLQLTRKGVHDTGGSGDESLKSEYGIYLNNVANVWVRDNEMTEVSGAGIFCDELGKAWIERNTLTMLAASDCLYPIHVETASDGLWIRKNHISGGERASGGAIDIMSQTASPTAPDPNKRIFIEENIIENCGGLGSGSQVIRLLSTENASVCRNIIRAIPASVSDLAYIHVDARTVAAFPEQPGPTGVLVEGNILTCGAAKQRAIDVRNDNAAGVGGDDVIVQSNFCLSDGTNYFASGIRTRDIDVSKVRGNIVKYKHNAAFVHSWGIMVTTIKVPVLLPEVSGNDIDCFSSTGSRAIVVEGGAGGDVDHPIIDGNIIRNAAHRGVQFSASANDPEFTNNRFYNTPVPLNNAATGNTTQHGNHYNMTAARSGTWSIASEENNVVVTTAEVRAGDRIYLTTTSDTGSEVPVKVSRIVTGTSFTVKTMDGSDIQSDDQNSLLLPGTSGNYASTPDSAALSITGDIDIRVHARLPSWIPAVAVFVGKAAQYRLRVVNSGVLGLVWESSGGTLTANSTEATLLPKNSASWVRATLDVDNGAGGYTVRFYTSINGTEWTQLGADVVGGSTTDIVDNADALEIGSRTGGTVELLTGRIYRVRIFASLDGSAEAFDANFTTATPAATSIVEDANGATVTVNQSGADPAEIIEGTPQSITGTWQIEH